MSLRLLPIAILSAGFAWSQAPVIPNTPAGHTLQAWLDAFNSGDRARIQAYVATYDPTQCADGTASFRERTGGFHLLRVDKVDRRRLEVSVEPPGSATVGVDKA